MVIKDVLICSIFLSTSYKTLSAAEDNFVQQTTMVLDSCAVTATEGISNVLASSYPRLTELSETIGTSRLFYDRLFKEHFPPGTFQEYCKDYLAVRKTLDECPPSNDKKVAVSGYSLADYICNNRVQDFAIGLPCLQGMQDQDNECEHRCVEFEKDSMAYISPSHLAETGQEHIRLMAADCRYLKCQADCHRPATEQACGSITAGLATAALNATFVGEKQTFPAEHFPMECKEMIMKPAFDEVTGKPPGSTSPRPSGSNLAAPDGSHAVNVATAPVTPAAGVLATKAGSNPTTGSSVLAVVEALKGLPTVADDTSAPDQPVSTGPLTAANAPGSTATTGSGVELKSGIVCTANCGSTRAASIAGTVAVTPQSTSRASPGNVSSATGGLMVHGGMPTAGGGTSTPGNVSSATGGSMGNAGSMPNARGGGASSGNVSSSVGGSMVNAGGTSNVGGGMAVPGNVSSANGGHMANGGGMPNASGGVGSSGNVSSTNGGSMEHTGSMSNADGGMAAPSNVSSSIGGSMVNTGSMQNIASSANVSSIAGGPMSNSAVMPASSGGATAHGSGASQGASAATAIGSTPNMPTGSGAGSTKASAPASTAATGGTATVVANGAAKPAANAEPTKGHDTTPKSGAAAQMFIHGIEKMFAIAMVLAALWFY